MKIASGQKLKIKGILYGRWQECFAAEEFNTEDTYFPLMIIQENKEFKEFRPLRDRCKLKLINEKGREKLIHEPI